MAEHMKQSRQSLSALDTIEEATSILRRLPLHILSFYYIGTLPFALGLLYFFTDMSKNPFAHEYCLTASFGMSVLFIWMKTYQAVFCTKLYSHLSSSPQPFSPGRMIKTAFTQTCIQASALIVLPVALIVTIPYAWVFAVYQMVLVEEQPGTVNLRKKIKTAYAAARLNTFANHMILLILTAFNFFVFLNIAAALYFAPFIFKTFMGEDTIFTLGGFNLFNTTFLITAACLTYLLTDPLIKVVYVIQKNNYTSSKTGDDLLSGLGSIRLKKAMSGLTALLLVVVILPAAPCSGAEKTDNKMPFTEEIQLSPDQFDAAVQKIISRPEYAWRFPQPEKQKAPGGFFNSILKWIAEAIKDTAKIVAGWFQSFFDWIKTLFIKDKKDIPEPSPRDRTIEPEHLAALLMLLCAILLGAVFYHLKKLKQGESIAADKTEVAAPDIEDENILADHLPAEQWRELAESLAANGDFRLAVRAVYLACLAELADHSYIRIAVHKSNRDYFMECSKKSAAPKQMIQSLEQLIHAVDRIWYGMHLADRKVYDNFLSTQEKVIRFASA